MNWEGGRGRARGSLCVTSSHPTLHSDTPHPNTEVGKLQALTHLQETLHACLIQDDIHRDPALRGSVHNVLEDIAISEEVHDHSNDLEGEGHR